MDFSARKQAALQVLSSPASDKSRKGGIDEAIVPLVTRINAHPSYFTTSSCSGRISISVSVAASVSESGDKEIFREAHMQETRRRKKGGDWSYISHSFADADEVVRSVLDACDCSAQRNEQRFDLMEFRFEPFILAVECMDMDAAQSLVSCAIQSGFRESGMTKSQRRIMVAVRSSIRIETPIAREGKLLVPEGFLRFLVQLANEKMLSNTQRIERFYSAFVSQVECLRDKGPNTTCKAKETRMLKLSRQFDAHRQNQCNGPYATRKFLDLERRQAKILMRLDEVEAGLTDTKSVSEGIKKSFCTTNIVSSRERQNKSFKITGQPESWTEALCAVQNIGCASAEYHKQKCCSSHGRGRFIHIPLQNLKASELLCRWGHSACLLPYSSSMTSVLIFGGYGAFSKQGRQNDLVLLNIEDGKVQSLCALNPPVARMGHTASLLGQKMVVIGGREDPSKPLRDVCVLEVGKMHWIYPNVGGNYFLPRHRHAAEAFGEKIFVFGGLNHDNVLGDLFILDISQMKWEEVISTGCKPSPRHSHSMAIAGKKLFLYGGFDGKTVYGDLWLLDMTNLNWMTVTLELIPRFSHSMTFALGHLIILGGCPLTKHTNTFSFLDVKNLEWMHAAVAFPTESLFVRHTAICTGNTIAIVGGGLSCYAFGIKFSPPFLVDLPFSDGVAKNKGLEDKRKYAFEEKAGDLYTLMVDKAHAKLCKDRLKWLGWLDSNRKAHASDDGVHVCFPLAAKNRCDFGDADLKDILDFTKTKCKICAPECHISLLIVRLEVVTESMATKDPHSLLVKAFSAFLRKNAMPISLLNEIPRRWERLEDMAILPVSAFTSERWLSFQPEIWQIVTKCLGAKRLARQARIKPNSTRDSNLVLLYGNDGWVCHRENGIIYCFDATKCMFSSGNVSEKLRMAKLDCQGETVVDLFAGIGYFVLPFLVRAKAEKVYACEWNPPALEALRRNLSANSVADSAVVLDGDNRAMAPKGVADRVCLGLLPSSEHCWDVAVKALRPAGGVLHIHGNVKDTEEQQWVDYVCTRVEALARKEGRCWNVYAIHVERVKWYAPHVRHLVVDIQCATKEDLIQ